jgi:hypothetical protein
MKLNYVKTFEQFIFEASTASSAIQSLENTISEKGFLSTKKAQDGDISKDDIKNLHTVLNRLGYPVGEDEESESYGQKTFDAVKQFQSDAKEANIQDPDGNIIGVDGLFGDQSLNVARMVLDDESIKSELDAQKGKSAVAPEDPYKINDESKTELNSFEDIKKLPGVPTEDVSAVKGGWYVKEGEFKGISFYSNNRYINSKGIKGSYSFNDGKLVLKADSGSTSVPTVSTTTPSTSEDFEFKNSKFDLVKFSDLKKATNKWYENKDIISTLIKNNSKDGKFIKEFNKLYQEKSGRTLIDFMTKIYGKSLTGGRGFEVGLEIFSAILNYIIDPVEDAKVIHFAISGLGTDDDLLKKVIDKRSAQSPQYKAKIASEYESMYDESLIDALEGDLDSDDQSDVELIKKIVPNYFG